MLRIAHNIDVAHCTEGIGIWQNASNDHDAEADVMMTCLRRHADGGILAAVCILLEHVRSYYIDLRGKDIPEIRNSRWSA
jgi:phosphoketolase